MSIVKTSTDSYGCLRTRAHYEGIRGSGVAEHQKDVSGQLHAPAALLPDKNPPLPTVLRLGDAYVCSFRRRTQSLASNGNRTTRFFGHPVRSLVIIPNDQPRRRLNNKMVSKLIYDLKSQTAQ
jgi:hypothetical protein